MSESTPTRETRRASIAQSRAVLRELIGSLSESQLRDLLVTPMWNGMDMLRHIWVWNDFALRCFGDWSGPRDWADQGSAGYDAFNEALVHQWDASGRDDLIARISAAYDRYDALLDSLSDAELAESGLAPWGEPTTRLGLLGTVMHDMEHYEHIQAALRS